MNKGIKNILYGLTIIITFLLCLINVKANTIKSIDMDISLDSEGNAHIKELWEANLTQGTEGYKPYSDLGISSISNFTVIDDSGKTYEFLSSWNTSASFSNKAYKNGINKTYDGVELCFGISNYGNRTYTLTYDISNFVTQYTDTQGIYFTFIDMEQYIGNAKITIHSDTSFSIEDNVKIWAFGYDGNISIVDGNIVLESNGSLSSSSYMSGLIRFETNMFTKPKESTKSFDDVYEDAMDGISEEDKNYDYGNDYDASPVSIIFGVLFLLIVCAFYLIFNPFTWVILFIILYMVKGKEWMIGSSKVGGLIFEGGKTLPKEINNFRDIPCDKDPFYAYFLAYNFDISSLSKIKEGIIGAVLLKWVKENKITITETKKGLLSFKDNNYAVDFGNMTNPNNELENELFKMLESAAGSNRILEAKEFEKWCTRNYYKVTSWFSKILSYETDLIEQKGLINVETEEVAASFGKTRNISIKHVKESVREEVIKLAGLKKFLLDTEIDEKKYIEVHLWNEYLIFAELLGIADKVKEQFSKLYPEFKDNVANMSNINYVTNIAYAAYRGYTTGINRASARSYSSGSSYSGSSRSSGGGGSSYSSGGHSSSGSHGGGFR